MSDPEVQEYDFHRAFILAVRKHFHFLELPGCEGQYLWMQNFYESIQVKGFPFVACGYFSIWFRLEFNFEPMGRHLSVTLEKLPVQFGRLDRATAPVFTSGRAPLDHLVALANRDHAPRLTLREDSWLKRPEHVEDELQWLAHGMGPVVDTILAPRRHAEPQEPDFPFFDEVAALDLESFKARLTQAQLEGVSS